MAPEELVETALARARALADLPGGALAVTKQLVRQQVVDYVRGTFEEDMEQVGVPSNVKKA